MKRPGLFIPILFRLAKYRLFFFNTVDRSRAEKLMQALDEVNYKYGAGTMAFAAAGIKRPWKTKFDRKSPRYKTRWEELKNITTA